MAIPELQLRPNQMPRVMPRNGMRVREDMLFANHKGEENKRIRKRAEQALENFQEPLQGLLQADETILYVAQANAPATLFEQATFGWFIYSICRTMLVFTNRRLLFFRVKSAGMFSWAWNRSLRAVRWGDLETATVKGSLLNRTLVLKYRNGKKETYWGVPRPDALTLKTMVPALVAGSVGEGTPAQSPVALCPDCRHELTAGIYTCGSCGLVFKDEKTLVRRSLVIPGGGYFYVGQRGLGLADAIAEAYLTILLVLAVFVMFLPADAGEESSMAGSLIIVGLVAAILALEKWFTIHHCRRMVREYLPTKQKATPEQRMAVSRG